MLKERFPDLALARGEASVVVDRDALLATLSWLRERDGLRFDWLTDVSATHWLERSPAFWLNYHLYSTSLKHRLRVKVGLDEGDATVPTVTGMFPTANWQEREVFDMDGIVFEGHPDLRRILMPEDWEGHPLRKDYAMGRVPVQFKVSTPRPTLEAGELS